MNLGMDLKPICEVCDHPISDHAPSCLCRQIDEIEAQVMRATCPICHKNAVGVNENDYLECRECSAQFSSSEFVAGHDPALLKRAVVIDWNRDKFTNVLVLPEKGDGNFPIDETVKRLRNEIEKLKKATSP